METTLKRPEIVIPRKLSQLQVRCARAALDKVFGDQPTRNTIKKTPELADASIQVGYRTFLLVRGGFGFYVTDNLAGRTLIEAMELAETVADKAIVTLKTA